MVDRSRAATQDRSGPATRFQVTDLFFRPLFAFFLIELKSRRMNRVGVTRTPTDAWVAQHLREATPYGQAPKYLIRDNDSKFGPSFARVAITSGIKLLKTPFHAPQANAVCERFAQERPARMSGPPADSSARSNSSACSMRMGCTLTRHGRIKGWRNRFLT